MKSTFELVNLIKAVIFDFDGVFTDNSVLEGAPYKGKWRSHTDGQGVSLLRAIGIRVALITNETGDHAQAVESLVKKWNGLPSAQKPLEEGGWAPVELFTGMGGVRKIEAAMQFLSKIDVSFEECAAMGDDLVDVPLLRKVGFPAAPISAERIVKEMVQFVSERPGGSGAVRDLVNFILEAREIDPTTLPTT